RERGASLFSMHRGIERFTRCMFLARCRLEKRLFPPSEMVVHAPSFPPFGPLPALRPLFLWSVALALLACERAPDPDPAALPLQVRVLYSQGGKGDHGFADSVYEGLVRAQ